MIEVHEIEYFEDIVRKEPGQAKEYLGKRRMKCKVEVTVPMSTVAQQMGSKACRSKSGKCVDGLVTVKRVGQPVEISREMRKVYLT